MFVDSARFDRLMRALGQTVTRRATLTALLASAVGPLLTKSDAAASRRDGQREGQQQGSTDRRRPPRGTPCAVCEDGCSYSSLQPAINAANDGDTIRICEGTYRSGPAISINKPLTLVGAGAKETVLKGSGTVRVMEIGPRGVVTMQGLTVTGGVERQVQRLGGAGIMVFDRGKLTLKNCLVEDNLATEGGGIAVSPGAELTLIETTVSDNTGLAAGGGLFVKAGGKATLGIKTRVTNNETRVDGAGIYLRGGQLLLEPGSRVEENSAKFRGGGIYVEQGSTATLAAGSRVTDNEAGAEGGGVFNGRGTVTIADTKVVRDNDPDNCAGLSGSQTANCIN